MTAISPNSTPRRRRAARVTQQYLETVRRAEQDGDDGDETRRGRNESFGTVSNFNHNTANAFLIYKNYVDQVESDSASRMPDVRDGGHSQPDKTNGRRPNGMDLAERPWKDKTFHADDLSLSSAPSGPSTGHGVDYARPRRLQDQSGRGGLARHMVPSRHQVTVRRPESRSTSTSTSESRDERRDVFDTAPPSDLDIRFPALSPEPSPLNSRRRGTAETVGDIPEREPSGDDEIASELSDRNPHPEEAVSAMAEVGMPDFDLRWRETKHLVDSYLSNRQHQLPGAFTEIHSHEAISVHETPLAPQTYSGYYPSNEIVNGSGSGGAVMDRLEAVTEEVQALREQVAELSNLLSRGLDGRRAPAVFTRHFDGEEGRRTQDARWTGAGNGAELGPPVSVVLPFSVRPLISHSYRVLESRYIFSSRMWIPSCTAEKRRGIRAVIHRSTYQTAQRWLESVVLVTSISCEER